MISRILRKERTKYGKTVRKKYESGEFWDSRHNMTRHSIRPDELSNTLSTVTKDNLLVEICGLGTDMIEKESDNLKDLNKRLNTFKQYDFTYASLFSGIGGFEQALNSFGGQCVFASEIDKFAARAYETLYGHKPTGDITQVDAKDVPDHELLVGGFPCQAFSVAGKRKGFEDTRGTLFFEIARIAREKQPKALLLENVKGLVNHDKGCTLDTMIRTLNDIGYIVDFDVLNSKYFGVPQNRERIFIVAVRKDLVEAEPFNDEATTGNTIVPKGKRRIGEWADVFNFDWPEQAEVSSRLRDILEKDVDEKYYLDEEKTAKLVAQLEEKDVTKDSEEVEVVLNADKDVIKDNERQRRIYSTNGISPTALARTDNAKIIEDPKVRKIAAMYSMANQSGSVYDKDGISPTLDTAAGGHREPKIVEEQEVRPVLTPDRMEKRQNGRRFKGDGEESFTLTSQDKHGIAIGNPPKYRIRKLTPLECFRLQGFPDEAHEAVKQAGISDSQRYKQAGNAVTVNVIEAIAERLIPIIAD